ncbi:MAG: transposase [Patescibacteria group bacterium]|nr:transposase [Patescibacteria group bacterium]
MTQRRIYQDEYPYFVTFRTNGGVPIFEDTKTATLLSDIIFKAGKLKGFDVLSYQIMPDHVHLLVNQTPQAHLSAGARGHSIVSAGAETRARGNNISQFMYSIKSYFIKQLRDKHGIMNSVWQRRFYTRIVNTEKYLETVLYYIKNNPVKASLQKKYYRVPYQYISWVKIRKLF